MTPDRNRLLPLADRDQPMTPTAWSIAPDARNDAPPGTALGCAMLGLCFAALLFVVAQVVAHSTRPNAQGAEPVVSAHAAPAPPHPVNP